MGQPRWDTNAPASFAFASVRGKGSVGNASVGGLFVESQTIPERGERLWLSFQGPDGESVEATGIVWWTTLEAQACGRTGFGVRLLTSSGNYRKFLYQVSHRPVL